jgi:peptidoglycan hydrolase-like amidase
MALRGKGYEEILQHYYGGADLMRWDGTLRQKD